MADVQAAVERLRALAQQIRASKPQIPSLDFLLRQGDAIACDAVCDALAQVQREYASCLERDHSVSAAIRDCQRQTQDAQAALAQVQCNQDVYKAHYEQDQEEITRLRELLKKERKVRRD